jgi:protein O-GlcNAc transferase
MSIPASIQEALAHQQAGRLPEAEAIYRQILQSKPDHPDALHLLGMVAHQAGNGAIAVELISRAIRIKPSEAMYRNNLGMALESLGEMDAAAESFSKGVSLKPGYAKAHYNLGSVRHKQGKLDEAAEHYKRAISCQPEYAEAYNNLGNALKDQGKPDEAVLHCGKALALKPDYIEAHYTLGAALQMQGKLGEAEAHYRQALTLKPDFAEAHYKLGYVLQARGELAEAILHCRAALVLKPGYVGALCTLGFALLAQGKLADAAEHYRQALALEPEHAEAHCNLGHVLQMLGRLDEAAQHCGKALGLKPDYADAHCNLGNVLLEQGQPEEAIRHYRQALGLKPDYADVRSNLLFLYGYHSSLEPGEYLALAREWEQNCIPQPQRQQAHHKTFPRAPAGGRRLKVGYVSGDYRRHPVSYFIEQLFARHDRARVELFAYSNSVMADAVTARLQSLADHWRLVAGMNDAEVLEQIESDKIDVLIDLSGHTEHNRMGVFARRAAPVQASYLGYFASTGLTEMDYWIGDDILTPPAMDEHFSEKIWRLPRAWVSYKTLADAPQPDWRPAEDGTVWIGSFNNLGKLTPQTLDLWAKVLHALPEGRLLLKNTGLADAGNRSRILDALAAHGIAASRIELQRESDWQSYMAEYNRLDIALDPVGGHGGGTITCDALWMGVPVIHALGDRATSRFTAPMLNAIHHPEWIAHSEAEYVAKVVALARDVEQRKTLRAHQRSRMAASPLCDAKDLAASLENAYFEMFERWLDKQNTY